MKCYKCGKGVTEKKSMFPVDHQKTQNRRWVCEDCISAEQKNNIPKQLQELCADIAKLDEKDGDGEWN